MTFSTLTFFGTAGIEFAPMISNSKRFKSKKINMKNLQIAFALILFAGFFSIDAAAQGNSGNHDINVEFNDITLLDVVSQNDLDITLTGDWGGVTAGEEISEGTPLATNGDNRLHYTVFSPQGGNKTFSITVQASGFEGQGWTIDVTPNEGNFGNNNSKGQTAGKIDLRNDASSPTNLITDIFKIAWTGTDVANDGWGLDYVLKVTDFDNFEAGNSSNGVTVTYTIDQI